MIALRHIALAAAALAIMAAADILPAAAEEETNLSIVNCPECLTRQLHTPEQHAFICSSPGGVHKAVYDRNGHLYCADTIRNKLFRVPQKCIDLVPLHPITSHDLDYNQQKKLSEKVIACFEK